MEGWMDERVCLKCTTFPCRYYRKASQAPWVEKKKKDKKPDTKKASTPRCTFIKGQENAAR